MSTYEGRDFSAIPPKLTAQPALHSRMTRVEDFDTSGVWDADETVAFLKLPLNAKIIRGGILCEALGGSADVDLRVTDGTTTKLLLDGEDGVQSAGIFSTDNSANAEVAVADTALGFVTDNQDYYVELLINTAGGNDDVNIQVFIEYTNILEANEAS